MLREGEMTLKLEEAVDFYKLKNSLHNGCLRTLAKFVQVTLPTRQTDASVGIYKAVHSPQDPKLI